MDKIICVGKNYLKHAQELGDAVPEEPVYFIKPPSSLCEVKEPAQVVHWPRFGEIHHEVELVFKLTQVDSIWQFSHATVGLDLTIRDLQSRLKKAGQPWEKSKVFKNSCVVGPWQPITALATWLEQPFSISINGEQKQIGFGRDMRWQPLELLADLQRYFPLCEGDLLFTGTPEGVGPIHDGDRIDVRGPDLIYSFLSKVGGSL